MGAAAAAIRQQVCWRQSRIPWRGLPETAARGFSQQPWWRATVDEVGHYSFAIPLWCRGPPRVPIGKTATPCDFALRLVGGCLHGVGRWSGYPS